MRGGGGEWGDIITSWRIRKAGRARGAKAHSARGAAAQTRGSFAAVFFSLCCSGLAASVFLVMSSTTASDPAPAAAPTIASTLSRDELHRAVVQVFKEQAGVFARDLTNPDFPSRPLVYFLQITADTDKSLVTKCKSQLAGPIPTPADTPRADKIILETQFTFSDESTIWVVEEFAA